MKDSRIKIGILISIFLLIINISGCGKKKSVYDRNLEAERIVEQIEEMERRMAEERVISPAEEGSQ